MSADDLDIGRLSGYLSLRKFPPSLAAVHCVCLDPVTAACLQDWVERFSGHNLLELVRVNPGTSTFCAASGKQQAASVIMVHTCFQIFICFSLQYIIAKYFFGLQLH